MPKATRREKNLPSPAELAAAVEEAETKLLGAPGVGHNSAQLKVKHRVLVQEDLSPKLQDLWLAVYVVGDSYEQKAFASWLSKSNCYKSGSLETADLVIFTGGPDVDPTLYGKAKHPSVNISPERDRADKEVYDYCLSKGIPMLGICRGAQFLHVMNGGKLYQHVDGHYGDHHIWDTQIGRQVARVSSNHHQSIIPDYKAEGFRLLATAGMSKVKFKGPGEPVTEKAIDVEAFFYRHTCCLGIQGHPEYAGYNEFSKWAIDKIHTLVYENPDLEWRGFNGEGTAKVLRISESILAERESIMNVIVASTGQKETN